MTFDMLTGILIALCFSCLFSLYAFAEWERKKNEKVLDNLLDVVRDMLLRELNDVEQLRIIKSKIETLEGTNARIDK